MSCGEVVPVPMTAICTCRRQATSASSSGSSTTLSCSLGSVRAMTAEARRVAQIGRQMRHAGRNVEEVAGLDDDVMLQPVAIPGVDLAGEHVDRRFVAFVQMRLGAGAGRHRQHVHADAGGTDRFGGYAGEIGQSLLAFISAFGTDKMAGGFRCRHRRDSGHRRWGMGRSWKINIDVNATALQPARQRPRKQAAARHDGNSPAVVSAKQARADLPDQ